MNKKCSAKCKTGKQCSRNAVDASDLCSFHLHKSTEPVVIIDTCSAICSNGQKCARKRCVGFEYCGTHKQEQNSDATTTPTCQHTIFVEDIDGIAYYLDSFGNIFRPEDILMQSLTPAIIGKRGIGGHCTFAF